jgi:hypothetical protein
LIAESFIIISLVKILFLNLSRSHSFFIALIADIAVTSLAGKKTKYQAFCDAESICFAKAAKSFSSGEYINLVIFHEKYFSNHL